VVFTFDLGLSSHLAVTVPTPIFLGLQATLP
jgi:hypothetical protein